MSEFLASNEWQWRLLRTIVQGVLGVVVALELGLCERGLDARAFSLRTCQRARSLNARSIPPPFGAFDSRLAEHVE